MSNKANDGRAVGGSKPGAEPTHVDVVFSEVVGPAPDATLIARSDGVAIWHTEKSAPYDVPLWLPPFSWDTPRGLYRGFPVDQLHNVLEHGLDMPPQCSFFATCYPDKAWEYPGSRELAAMLVLDRAQAKPSYVRKPVGADSSWRPDKTLYPNTYRDGQTEVHTRFADGRGPRCLMLESMYGHWIPGDARAALFAVILGGPRAAIQEQLVALQGRGSYSLEFSPRVIAQLDERH